MGHDLSMQPNTHTASSNRVFVAGAAGVIGRQLCKLLVADGFVVFGTTRAPEKAAALRTLGVEPLVLDVFDQQALARAVLESKAGTAVHQLTDLPQTRDPAKMAAALIRNAQLRELGTRNLVAACVAAGVSRLVAQSIAFAYAPGPRPYGEDAPLNVAAAEANAATTVRGVASLEQQVLAGPFDGIVLRYGRLYGPGTWFDTPPDGGPVHVDAAADAARRAIRCGSSGIYNIAESDGMVSILKAQRELGWSPGFRIARDGG